MKKCTRCKIEKPLTDYCLNKDTKDGRDYSCKECVSKRRKELYEQDKQRNTVIIDLIPL